MRIDWGKIITNAVSTLITAIIIGACAIVWQGATTVDKKVNDATQNTNQTVNYVKDLVEILQEEFDNVRSDQAKLSMAFDEYSRKLDEYQSRIVSSNPSNNPLGINTNDWKIRSVPPPLQEVLNPTSPSHDIVVPDFRVPIQQRLPPLLRK